MERTLESKRNHERKPRRLLFAQFLAFSALGFFLIPVAIFLRSKETFVLGSTLSLLFIGLILGARKKKTPSLQELAKTHEKLRNNLYEVGSKIGEMLVDSLAPIIPGLRFSLGWEEAGIDTICLWCNHIDRPLEEISLLDVLEEELDKAGLKIPIDTPSNIFISKTEAHLVRAAIKSLLKKGNEGP